MPLEIPGYYYDTEKRKYFKIEKSHTAPSAAAWSSDEVKRRKIQDRAGQAARQREYLVRNHIKRSGLARDIVTSGVLARELGEGRAAELGRGRAEDGDVGAAAWSAGVVEKGCIPFAPSFARARFANMSCFYVSGDDSKTGLGVAYATLDDETLVGSYIPTDENDRIHFSREAQTSSGRNLSFRTEMIRCPQMSSIRYHQPSHKIMLTSREPDHSCGLYFFSPPLSGEDDQRPYWLLGETYNYRRCFFRYRLHDELLVHRSTPAPASSDLLCVIGTNAGLLRVFPDETMARISPKNPQKGLSLPQEIFDQDFQQGNHNVLLAGGRQPRLWMKDLRTSEAEWTFIRHGSSIANVRSVNQHHVLVAGLENSMSLYDLRYLGQRPNGAKPLLNFPSYRNEAHFHVGWDVCSELGLVASAQDDGTVKLFSLRSGNMLPSPELATVKTETPIRAMMFQQMPREKAPSLFVGEGPSLRKFSFGTTSPDQEA